MPSVTSPSVARPNRPLHRLLVSVIGVGAIAMAAGGAAAGASPAPSAIPVLPGEPWIVSFWNSTPGHANGLSLMRPDGTDDHLILPAFSDPSGSVDWGKEGALHPDWSPDGTQLAFTNGADESWSIWIANVDGTDARQVVPCSAPCQAVDNVAWSPHGTQLVYSRWTGAWPPKEYTSATAVDILDLETGETRTVLESHAEPPQNPEFYWNPRWSPDGRSLVLSIGHIPVADISDTAIAIVDVSGDGPATPRVITDPALFAGWPDWSPDGERIVFDTNTTGFFGLDKTTDLYTIRPDGTGLTQVTDTAGTGEWTSKPTWTPDGLEIIFDLINGTQGGPVHPESVHAAFIHPDGSERRVLDGGYQAGARLRPIP